MCGRFVQERSHSELAEIFDAEVVDDGPGGRYNLAPTDPAAVVVQRPDGRRGVAAYRFGLLPTWARRAADGARMINARAETISTSPAFRVPFRRRRCLVPADAFYEWVRVGERRQPYAIRFRDGEPMAFAGIWTIWREPATDERIRSFAIVTGSPNDVVAPVHDRMPVVLPRDRWDRWLDASLADVGELHGLLVPHPPEAMERFAVAPLVNDVRRNGPELLSPTDPVGTVRPPLLG